MHYSREFFIIRIFQRTVQYRAGPYRTATGRLSNTVKSCFWQKHDLLKRQKNKVLKL
jgi:hypothetical protein